MSKNMGQVVGDIYELLKENSPEDNAKILASIATLLDIGTPSAATRVNENYLPSDVRALEPKQDKKILNAKAFFDEKSPENRGEEFAVAAKYRELNNLGEAHTKDDLREVIKIQAKRNFDDKNFSRDIENAIRQAKFFIKGESKGEYLLSSTGEIYVEALPDRSAAKATKKVSKTAKPKKKAKKVN